MYFPRCSSFRLNHSPEVNGKSARGLPEARLLAGVKRLLQPSDKCRALITPDFTSFQVIEQPMSFFQARINHSSLLHIPFSTRFVGKPEGVGNVFLTYFDHFYREVITNLGVERHQRGDRGYTLPQQLNRALVPSNAHTFYNSAVTSK